MLILYRNAIGHLYLSTAQPQQSKNVYAVAVAKTPPHMNPQPFVCRTISLHSPRERAALNICTIAQGVSMIYRLIH